VPWVEVFAVFIVSHLAGDFLLQTDWQAKHKRGGLSGDREARRALLMHVTTYTLAFVPALIWLAGDLGAAVFAVAGLIFLPHLLQDDGRLLERFTLTIKGIGAPDNALVFTAADQSMHVIVLFGIALLTSEMAS
jgi:Protein of unknown function (DUF3307)